MNKHVDVILASGSRSPAAASDSRSPAILVPVETVNPAEDTIQAFPDGRQGKRKRKRQEPDQEDGLVVVMRDTGQVMGITNQVLMSDENDDLGRQVAHSLRSMAYIRLREVFVSDENDNFARQAAHQLHGISNLRR